MDQDAFREALFESLQDPTAAQRWEQIYGQPLHIYPRPESMDDDMYIEYVKEMMWQNTEEAREEQKARRERERRWRGERDTLRARERAWKARQEEKERRERDVVERVDLSREAWERYDAAWTKVRNGTAPADANPQTAIPWPVLSGRFADVSRRHVEEFFRSAPPDSANLVALLKAERVRWHPDKVQQKFAKLDDQTLKKVTGVFQDVDRMYTTLRG